jgi:hypothetical protein
MSAPDTPRDDAIDVMLGADRRPCGDDRLRAAVLARTISTIRFHRRLKRCALAAALVGCYLAGAVTMRIWNPIGGNLPQPAVVQVAQDQQPQPVVSPSRGPVRSADHQFASVKISRYEAVRRAADRNLLERDDLPSAIRGYKRALDLASAEERAISPVQDSWLLMALKDAREKERKHVYAIPN